MIPRADDIAQWVADARDTGMREGVLACARFLRSKGKLDEAMALVFAVNEICGSHAEQEPAPVDLQAACSDLTWRSN
jgi:hypothetical protein